MRKLIAAAIAALTLALASTAAAALVPGVFDPGNTGCPTATFSHGVLHLAKNCATSTNAAAGADITGASGAFTSASFTLASASQCQGGSPRFDVVTTTGTFFLGCNNVTPTINANGTATYVFTPAALAAASLPVPTGTITAVDVLVDVQGTADVSKIVFNGTAQVPVPTRTDKGHHPKTGDDCKHGGWKHFTHPRFKNQGQCVSDAQHHKKAGEGAEHKLSHGESDEHGHSHR